MKNVRLILSGLSLCFACLIPGTSSAQTTGSYNASISFMGVQRTLSLYVPASYNPANSYALMVCLHGAGDNSTNYRNALVGPLAFNAALPNTIFVCPDVGTDPAHDFYTPAGDEAIIDSAIAYARSIYNIDTTQVVLQGFSLGGRSALRYGLSQPQRFKGLMLNTPAMQGVKDALNQGASTYAYANAGTLPIYVTHGADDIFYSSPIDTLMEQLILNDARVRLVRVPGLAHTIPAVSQMPQFTTWFDAPVSSVPDLDLVKIIAPLRSCDPQLHPSLLIRNMSSTQFTSASFEYHIGSANASYTWNGSLGPFQHAVVSLPAITAVAGAHDLDAKLTMLNGSITDTVIANNEKAAAFLYEPQGMSLPLMQDFEDTTFPPSGWIQRLAGDVYSPWDWDNTVAHGGAASMFAFNTALLFDNKGRKEELETPLLNLQSAAHPSLSFDVAYNYHRYTPPYVVDTTNFADTLVVLISTDCGSSFQTIYKKGGADLATFPSPILNPLNVNACYAVPAAANWRTESIDLTPYATSSEAIIRFSYVSALGGSINLDNIDVKSTLGITGVAEAQPVLYPNPAGDFVQITAGSEHITGVDIMDMSGRTVWSVSNASGSAKMEVNTSALAPGSYVCRIKTGGATRSSEKLVISR